MTHLYRATVHARDIRKVNNTLVSLVSAFNATKFLDHEPFAVALFAAQWVSFCECEITLQEARDIQVYCGFSGRSFEPLEELSWRKAEAI